MNLVEVGGIHYKVGLFVVVDSTLLPTLACIIDIVIISDGLSFYLPKFQNDDVDELFSMMRKSKTGDSYVCDIKSSPDPAIIIASDAYLDDLVKFCAYSPGVDNYVFDCRSNLLPG